MLFNYAIGRVLSKENQYKKQFLLFGIGGNLLLLGYFKYSDFFIANINTLLESKMELLDLALPLAISFFTFQQIAYLVDAYRGETKEYKLLNYGLFVTFFPQLIAGPIVHHKEMMPQFLQRKKQVINHKNIALGLFLFSIGLFKKVVIADTFAVWATNGFNQAEVLGFIEAWVTSLSYTFQLYFDFSAYTDMAIGVALLFNIVLPINFNSPYKATNIQEFWRRWHITLSRFLRDYIYIPLGGNRVGSFRNYSNLMMTFIIGGIWHGAGWTFIFWGFLHGFALIIHRIWNQLGFKINTLFAWFVTFNFINITWVFFRASEWNDAVNIIRSMLGLNGMVLPNIFFEKLSFLSTYGVDFGGFLEHIHGSLFTFFWLFLTLFLVLFCKNSMEKMANFRLNYQTVLFTAGLLVYAIYSMHKVSEFLYFNF